MCEHDDHLKLENQLCFLMYACSRLTSKYYHPFIDKMGLTYTQYLTMLVLWEVECINVKNLGDRLYLDSGTLTPMLKRLEEKGYVNRERSSEDERQVEINLTKAGRELKKHVQQIYEEMESWSPVSETESEMMSRIFLQALDKLNRRINSQ